jgi:hypothetical protein
MKAIHWIIAAAVLAFVEPAQAGVNDPEVIIYRFPGVLDNGGAPHVGVATVFHCTNFSGVEENIRFVTRNGSNALLSNALFSFSHLQTISMSTHITIAYGDFNLGTGAVNTGTTAIAATSINIACTAVTIDASTTVPVGVALRGIRFSPVPGSQEYSGRSPVHRPTEAWPIRFFVPAGLRQPTAPSGGKLALGVIQCVRVVADCTPDKN